MESIKEYKLVMVEEDQTTFIEEVNNLISQGWQPLGGVCITKGSTQRADEENSPAAGYDMQNTLFISQAMVK